MRGFLCLLSRFTASPINSTKKRRVATYARVSADNEEQLTSYEAQVLMKSLDTTALESELSELETEINIAAELIEDCINENAHVALYQTEHQKRYDALVAGSTRHTAGRPKSPI